MSANILPIRRDILAAATALAVGLFALPLHANPGGGTVVQGNATFKTQGPQFTIQTSDKAQINWSTFNIGVGETTTFLQPSSSSVVWNQINDANPSQILGNLNANGYVILQNPSGFYIGGQAVINTHGLLMTTSPTPAPDLSSGGAWQFNAPPPTASIINYGQIKTDGASGASIFLIAAGDVKNGTGGVQNFGTISAPQGDIGLCAGKQVQISTRPDGRGLSAKVTLPAGSVDNQGQLIADAGTIAMHAQVVNQGGLLQANSVRQANGVIELVASDSLNLGAKSVLSAQGDATSAKASQAGFVVLKSDGTFADTSGSSINVAGKVGGRDGVVGIAGSATTASTVQSQIDGQSAANFQTAGGLLMVNPQDLAVSSSASTPSAPNPNLSLSDLSSFSKIDLFALGNLNVNGTWTLSGSPDQRATLNLTGGEDVSLLKGPPSGFSQICLSAPSGNLNLNGTWNLSGSTAFDLAASGNVNLNSSSDVTLKGNWNLLYGGDFGLSASAGNLNVSGTWNLLSSAGIDVSAARNISVNGAWKLSDSPDPDALLSLTAGNNITLGSAAVAGNVIAGRDWRVSMSAGPLNLTAKPASGDYIHLLGDSYIQTQNGDINLWAANEITVNSGLSTSSGIRTLGGGNIAVTAQFGDVNSGGNYLGYDFSQTSTEAPYYSVMQNLGGISTYAGGNVTITAGRNVASFLPVQSDYYHALYDGGSGAFGAQPGNVTVTAGGKVSGHYVVANGVGSITAGGNIGVPSGVGGFALSLVKGSWSVFAPHGSIYAQDLRNPNGVFNDAGGSIPASAGYHRFDYDPSASVRLQAGNLVEITGSGAPHLLSDGTSFVPMLLPPTLQIVAGAGGFVLNSDVTLFPSPYGELQIVTTGGGSFQSFEDPDPTVARVERTLAMSGSGAVQWDPTATVSGGFGSFGPNDNASAPPELNNPNHVELHISGDINNIRLRTTKAANIAVEGSTLNFDFQGANLHAADALHGMDTTTINVAGTVSYSPTYTFTTLSTPITSANSAFNSSWDAIFSLLVDTSSPLLRTPLTPDLLAMTPQQQTAYAFANLRLSLSPAHQLSSGYDASANPGFVYDTKTGKLGYKYQMSSSVFDALDSAAIPILKLDQLGHVALERHADGKFYFATTTASFAPRPSIESLFTQSQNSSSGQNGGLYNSGFQLGGPGQFNVSAASIDMGSSLGIVSWGMSAYSKSPINYSFLVPETPSGATLNVKATGDISLLTSAIASIQGGDVVVNSGGTLNLSQGDFAFIPKGADMSYGIFTSGHSDVKVTAEDDINIGGARIAAFNGGNIFVRSEHGNVNAGNGANALLVVPVVYRDPLTGRMVTGDILNPRPFGSGIIAVSPSGIYPAPGTGGLPGDITIETPNGNIVSTLGGISQFALNGSTAPGPKITLVAGTAPANGSPGHPGNVDLGQGGVVGGTIDITAQGDIKGLIVSRQDANLNAAQSFSGTLLSGGAANVNAVAGTSGTIIGITSASVSGGPNSADIQSQNTQVGNGPKQSTLGPSATPSDAAKSAGLNDENPMKLASDTSATDDDGTRRRGSTPTLTRRVGRVRVILPPA